MQAKKYTSDIIFLPGYYECGFLAYKAQLAGIRAIPLGGDGWGSKKFLNEGGKHIKLGYFCVHWSEKSKNPVSINFVKKYKNNKDIAFSFALSHDAVFLLEDAIKRAGSTGRVN